MIRNYIKIAWRNIQKHKFHSILNIAGLSIGIGFTLLIASYVWSELQVNHNLRNVDNQYIVQSNWKDPDMGLPLTTVGPMVKALKEQYPSLVANYYRWDGITSNVSKGDKVFREGLQVGDSTFLQMYGFKILYGDKRNALNTPFSAVITEDAAIKYFGRKDVAGESLTIENFSGSKHDFKVTAVIENLPYNSVNRITFDNNNQVFIPVNSITYFNRSVDAWDNSYIAGFVELQKGVNPQDLEGPMQKILKQNASARIADNMRPYLTLLTDYYLKQNNAVVLKMVYTVSFIALFILLMAIINFINITIGNSSTRIKEIGVRKVMGGLRKQLIYQFLSESILIVFFSMLVALGIYYLANPFLSDALGKQIPKLTEFPIAFALVPVLLIFLIGTLAGLYPAFVLSASKAVDLVKGKLHSINANIFLRKSLVGFQFFTASVVLGGAIVLAKQVSMFFSNELGYDKEYVVSVQTPRDWTDAGVQRMQTIRDEFARLPEVASSTLTWSVPDGVGIGTTMLFEQGKDSTQAIPYESLIADEKYMESFKIPLVAGRTFNSAADSLNIVINETAVKTSGFKSPDQAIGSKLYASANYPFTVIGVIKDFHFGSMKDKIKPMIVNHVSLGKVYRLLCFKLKPGNINQSLEVIQKKWQALMPGTAFEYKFMDDTLQRLYKTEIQLKKASQIATVLAIIIVVLGIIGLISLSIQKRTKEIGIRKVLGASVTDIASLFVKDFLPVLMISGIISVPVAYYIMHNWLNDYNYRVPLTAIPFIASIIALGAITTLLIAFQTFKTAVANPVKSLRNE